MTDIQDGRAPNWLLLDADYRNATVHLATISVNRVQHLVFGFIELIPQEISEPVSLIDFLNVPGVSGLTLVYSRTTVSVEESLLWYSDAQAGNLHVPKQPKTTVRSASFACEPAWGCFVAGGSAPYAAPWHDGPRTHRLVPMTEPASELLSLKGNNVQEQIRATRQAQRRIDSLNEARIWFARRLGFDVFDWDDWLGAIVLVAPNPICRTILTSIIERCPMSGAETILVEAEPRDRVDLTTLRIDVIEKRVDGWLSLQPIELDNYGRGTISLGQRSTAIGLTVRCNIRGLIGYHEPYPWFRGVDWSTKFAAQHIRVAVPSGGRARPATTHDVTLFDVEHSNVGEPNCLTGETRLRHLVQRREVRRGTSPDEELIFMPGDRERAVTFIRARLARATTRALIIDPFIEPRDLYEFGIQSRQRGIATTFIRSLQGLEKGSDMSESRPNSLGRRLQAHSSRLRQQLGTEAPVVLLMNDRLVFHDRLLIVDDRVWLMGHSLNSVGLREVSTMVKLRSPVAMLALAEESVRVAHHIDTWSP